MLTSFSEYPSQDSLTGLQENEACASLLERYSTYCEKTRQGDHGKTAMFWMIYVDLVHYYLLLDRAYRTNDVDLYIFALSKICPIFFITHRPNYATLEQTINKDAASRHTGISAFTQCVKARKRLTVTHSMRGAVVACLLDMAAITTKDEITQELKLYRIKRDNADWENLIKTLEDTMNPFQNNPEDKL